MSQSENACLDEDELLVNFHDALIYRRDLRILQSPTQWLNSDCIHFHLQCLQHSSLLDHQQLNDVILMDPSVTSFLVHQCNDEDEIKEFCTSRNNFNGIRWIYLPINDAMFAGNANWWASQGTHWSLLRIHVSADTSSRSSPEEVYCIFAEHYNSMFGTNQAAATSVYEAMQRILCAAVGQWPSLRIERTMRIMENAPQQSNGYDCGLYVLFMMEQLLQGHAIEQVTKLLKENPRVCTDYRRQMAQTVEKLSAKAKKSMAK